MDDEEVQGVKFSEFPSAIPNGTDELVGLHANDNARFPMASLLVAIRQAMTNIFVPTSRVGVANGVASLDGTGKVPSSQLPLIPSDAEDITYDNTSSGLPATNVQDALDEAIEYATLEFGSIEGVIPSEASASNQLADKAFVTDSITQGTAIFRGSFASKAALLAVAWQTTDPDAPYFVSNNDYAVVLDDETQNDECWRYIYVTGTGWTPQYKINESPMTQAQLDALNSGATSVIINSVADKLDKTGDGKDVTATFTAASTRANISTGEKLSVLFGKIAKWFTDLGTAAFRAATGSITSGSTALVESGAVYTGLAGKQNKIIANGILKGDGQGGVSAATAETDYGTYSKPSGGIPASDLASGVIPTVPSASTANPQMDGAASPGNSGNWARGNHVHPSDTSRVPVYGLGKNLVDNWYFVGGGTGPEVFPVNQRHITSSSSGYAFDRWRPFGSGTNYNWSLTAAGLQFENSSSNNYACPQDLSNAAGLLGKRVTYSILTTTGLYKNSGVLPSTFNNSGGQISVSDGTNVIGQLYVTSSTIQARLRSPAGSGTITFVAVKLELGREQTLAHLENGAWVLNEIPDYEEELVKCQTSTADTSDTYANKTVSVNVTNRNLLDNWYFMQSQVRGGQLPINRRGLTTVNTGKTYFIDRWAIFDGNGSAAISSSGLSITGGTNWLRFGQQIPIWKVVGIQVTLSVLVESITSGGTFNLLFGESSGDIINNWSPSGYNMVSATSAGLYQITAKLTRNASGYDNDLLNVLFRISQGATAVIKAAKLEYGSQQTLAHQENGTWVLNEIPDYNEELIKCETNQAGNSTDVYANKAVSVNIPNRNLLDNAYFVGGGSQLGDGIFPINQRGQTSYSTDGYALDRWYFNPYSYGTLTLTAAGLKIAKNGATSSPGIRQDMEHDLDGRIVTFSALNNAGNLYIFTSGKLDKTVSGWQASNNFGTLWVGIRYISGKWSVNITVSSTITLAALKLELGTQSTLAYPENAVMVLAALPDFWAEYANAQRYLKVINAWRDLYAARIDNNNLSFFIPGHMVKAPSTLSSQQIYYYSTTSGNVTGNISFVSVPGGVYGSVSRGNLSANTGGSVTFPATVYISAEQ